MLRYTCFALLFNLCITDVSAEPYPLDYWARRSAVTGVSLSPDGSQFALTRILSVVVTPSSSFTTRIT